MKDVFEKLESGELSWENANQEALPFLMGETETLTESAFQGKESSAEAVVSPTEQQKVSEPEVLASQNSVDTPAETPEKATTSQKEVTGEKAPKQIANSSDTPVTEPQKDPLAKLLEEVSELKQELKKVGKSAEQIEREKVFEEISSSLSQFKVDLGESFYDAETKWSKIYSHFSGDEEAIRKFLDDPEAQKKSGLELPKNLNEYFRLSQVYRNYQEAKKLGAKGRLEDFLSVYGYERIQPKMTVVVPQADAQQNTPSSARQAPGILPPGNGVPMTDASSALDIVFKKLETLGDNSLTPKERELLIAALEEDAR